MRRPNSHTHMTRRAAMAGAILAPLALPALAAPIDALAMTGEADPHPEWLAAWHDQRAAANMRGASDDDIDAAVAAMDMIEARMAQTPARTAAGCAAQIGMVLALRAAQRAIDDAGDELDVTLRRAADALRAM